METIVWPGGYLPLRHLLRKHSEIITTGTVLALDPASGGSSMPGWAIFEAGICISSGAIPFPVPKERDVHKRLPWLYDKTAQLLDTSPDVLAIEEVHKSMSGAELQYAIGVSIAAIRAPITIQVPINLWKAVAKADAAYRKGDEADAIKIGQALIEFTRHLGGAGQ